MTTTYNIGNSTISNGATIGIGGSGGTGTVTLNNSTSGAYLVTGSSTGYTWSNPTTTFTNGSNVMVVKNDPASLEVKGNLVINGRDLEERLSTIEKVLQIPERDVKLEAKYPSLKKKYDEYIKDLSKYRMWEAIKGEDND